MLLARLGGLWGHPDFVRLWTAQTVSVFGTMITGTALPFTAILALDASPLQVAALAASGILPGLLVGPVAGVWVDRLRRRPVMIAADIGRAGLLLSVPLAWWFDVLRIEQLFIVAFGAGVLTTFFDLAYYAYLPSLVSRDELIEGNSKLTASASVAEFSGFSISGWLVQAFTGPGAVFVDACTFVFSAVFLRSIRARELAPDPPPDGASVRGEAIEGMRAVWRQPVLRSVAVATLLYSLGFGIFSATYMLFVTRTLGFEPGVLGVIFGIGGLSSLAGSLYARRAALRFGVGAAMIGGVLMMGLSMLFIPLAAGATVFAGLMLIAQQVSGDGGFTGYQVNEISLRQAIADERMLGRINAFMRMTEVAFMLGGTLLGGLLAETFGLRPALTTAGLLVVGAAAWLAASPVRDVREAPEPPPTLATDAGALLRDNTPAPP